MSNALSAAELRRAFDDAFARPAESAAKAEEDLLLIRAHGNELALRTREIARVVRCPPLTRLPTSKRSLVGLAAVRGVLVTVYDVAHLTGAGQPPGQGGWLALSATDRSVAFLFDEVVAFERVPHAAIRDASATDDPQTAVAMIRDEVRTVVSVSVWLTRIHQAAAVPAQSRSEV